MNVELKENFHQVCIWPACIVGKEDEEKFKVFMLENFDTRIQYLEEIKTEPDLDSSGTPIKDTGNRNDLFFAVHNDDVGKFSIPRLQYGIRWLEDVLDSGNYSQPIYPERVFKYKCWSEDEKNQEED